MKVLVAFVKQSFGNEIRSVLSAVRSVKASYVKLGNAGLSLCGDSFDVIYLQGGSDRVTLSKNLASVRSKYPSSRLVLALDNFGISDIVYGHRVGISAIVDERATADQILSSLGAAARGDLYVSSSVVKLSQNPERPASAPGEFTARTPGLQLLSQRETEVLGLVAKGMANRAIATALFISEKTVKNHLYNIFKKIGVTDRTKAALFAVNALTVSGGGSFDPVQQQVQSDTYV